MVQKRKKKKPAKRKKGKSSIVKQLLVGFSILIALVLVAGVVYFWPQTSTKQNNLALDKAGFDSLFLASGLDPEKDKQIVRNPEGEVWKVKVESLRQKRQLVNAFKHMTRTRNWSWVLGKETRHKDELIQSIDLRPGDQESLRIILALSLPTEQQSKPDPKAPLVSIILDDIGHEPVQSLKPVFGFEIPDYFCGSALPF